MVITYSAQLEKTIATGKIAIGIKNALQFDSKYEEIEYVLLHNWQNKNAHIYKLISKPHLVRKDYIEQPYFLKFKDSDFFILLDIDNMADLYKDQYDIMHLQPSNRKQRYDLMLTSFEELMEPDI